LLWEVPTDISHKKKKKRLKLCEALADHNFYMDMETELRIAKYVQAQEFCFLGRAMICTGSGKVNKLGRGRMANKPCAFVPFCIIVSKTVGRIALSVRFMFHSALQRFFEIFFTEQVDVAVRL
jgi:hypothetical protein